MSASLDFRENPDRAIFLTGFIGQELVNSLTPQILKLRHAGTDPITVFIDSPGGHPALGTSILRLLEARDADGHSPSIVTVVTGEASSAAADFLAAGAYAIAYPHAKIHFHGSRHGLSKDLTMEAAALTAKVLREYNEIQAIDLAENVVARCIFIYVYLRDQFDKIRERYGSPGMTEIECFSRSLYAKLSSQADSLPGTTRERYNQIQALSNSVFARVTMLEKASLAASERKILRAIIDYEYKRGIKQPFWSFTEDNLDRIVEDFRLIKDFVTGSHNDSLDPLSKTFGKFFLSKADKEYYKTNTFKDDDERHEWLRAKVQPHIRPLWYFIVSLCRLLQEKENPLTARDAYWLGIVNEVMGSTLPCIRQVVENQPSTDSHSASEPASE